MTKKYCLERIKQTYYERRVKMKISKLITRGLSLILSAAMFASLAACSNKDGDNADTAKNLYKAEDLVLPEGVENVIKVANIKDSLYVYGTESETIGEGESASYEYTGNLYILETDTVILATGHNNRFLYKILYNLGVKLSPKPFALGFRVEHPKSLIDNNLYGKYAQNLPSAIYNLKFKGKSSNVFSFCMCPGGEVLPANSKIDEIVTKNHALFIGTNEAELFAREEIADFIIDEIVDTVRLFTDLEREEILMIYYSSKTLKESKNKNPNEKHSNNQRF